MARRSPPPDEIDAIGLGQRPAREPLPPVSLAERASASGDRRLVRAAEAQRLLQEPLLREAIAALELGLLKDFRQSKAGPEGAAVRELAHSKLAALDEIVRLLHRVIRDGQLNPGGNSGGS